MEEMTLARAEERSPFDVVSAGRSVSWPAAYLVWMAAFVVASWLGPEPVAMALLFLPFVVTWIAILAVAALTPPPPRLAEASILAERMTWLVRTMWATVVLAAGAVFSSLVAIDLTASTTDPRAFNDTVERVLLESIGALAGVVGVVATMLASSTVPIQLWRAGVQARASSVGRLLLPLHVAGFPTAWMARLLMELSTLWMGLFICYLAPPLLWALIFAVPSWKS